MGNRKIRKRSRIRAKTKRLALKRFRVLHGKQRIIRSYKGIHRGKRIFGFIWELVAKYYRNSLVKMYYAKTIKRHTPTPFAEFRVFMFLTRAISNRKRLKKVLTTTQKYFPSLAYAMRKGQITAKIEGEELEQIDEDELYENFKTTGWKTIEFNRCYRYVAFFKADNTIRKDYNDKQISIMIGKKLSKWFKRFKK